MKKRNSYSLGESFFKKPYNDYGWFMTETEIKIFKKQQVFKKELDKIINYDLPSKRKKRKKK